MWNITNVMRDVEFHGGYCDDSNPSLKLRGCSAGGADGLEDWFGIWIQYCRYRGNNNTADGVR